MKNNEDVTRLRYKLSRLINTLIILLIVFICGFIDYLFAI